MSSTPTLIAAVFNGGGIQAGMQAAAGITGMQNVNIRTAITNILAQVLNFLGVLAVATVVAAGVMMILSLGDQERVDKAKKMIKYTLIGLLVIFCARILVALVTEFLPSNF